MRTFAPALRLFVLGSLLLLSSRPARSTLAPPEYLGAPSRDAPQVAGGTAVAAGQFPFLVAVLGDASLCTGSIIAPKWILTAAHCGLFGAPDTVLVSDAFPGVAGPGHEVEVLPIKRWIPHPGFDGSLPPAQTRDDIALIELFDDATAHPPRLDGTPLYTPAAIALASAPASTTSSLGDVILAGFGLTDLDLRPLVALWAVASSFPAASCTSPIHASRQLCYGTYPTTCSGDSGGAVFQSTGSSLSQLGIVSYGPDAVCGTSLRNSVATYVPYYRAWIDGFVNAGAQPTPVPTPSPVATPSPVSTPTPATSRTPRPSARPPSPIRLGWELPPKRSRGVASGVSNAQGWVFSREGEIVSVELFVDGKKEATLPCCSERADAPGPVSSGFSAALNWGRFDAGTHTMRLLVKDSAGNRRSESRTVETVKILDDVSFVRDLNADRATCTFTGPGAFECAGLEFARGACDGVIRFAWTNGRQAFEPVDGCR